MISYGAINARLAVLQNKYQLVDAQWQTVNALPDDEPSNIKRAETIQALQILRGRILECQVWLEWGERNPHIERADQMPTERNMPKHDAIADTTTEAAAWRDRETLHHANADQLLAALPDLGVE